MNLNPSPKVRFAIYVLLGIGTILEQYLLSKQFIGLPEDTAWKAFVVFAGGLAAYNTK